MSDEIKITEADLDDCWQYLVDILNGEYLPQEAREDIMSLIGSEYDNRIES